jgi:tellurite resistance protein
LKILLEKVNNDFAVALLAQCHKIAQVDGIMTPEEQNLIEIIIQTLNLEGESLNL